MGDHRKERLGKTVIYVPGNHEYYGEPLSVLAQMKALTRGSRVHVLDMDALLWDGVRFLGATLWTDYLLFGRALRPEAMERAAHSLNDHRLINRPEGFTPADALERHEAARAWLETQLASKWDDATVVITHHAPSALGTHARFRHDRLTGAFVSDLEQMMLIYSPDLWVHGHTHHCVHYEVGRTRVVANQLGYPHEPATGRFDPCLVVESVGTGR